MIGIYKITSPTGKIYIGQTINIVKRRSKYKNLQCKSQPKLYASLFKYGWASHEFSVLHPLPIDVDIEVLNAYEILYIQAYKDAGFELMNLNDGGRNAIPGEETRLKMSDWQKGKTLEERIGIENSIKQKERMSKAKKGVPHTKEHSYKISASLTGNIISQNHRNNISKSNTGRLVWNKGIKGVVKMSEETKKKQSEARKKYLLNNPVTGICATYVNR